MDIELIRARVSKEVAEGRVKKIFTRKCTKPDIEGVRKILKEHPEISVFQIAPVNPFNFSCVENEEIFYELNDKELAKEARLTLLTQFDVKQTGE